jgi:hypothetical protein
VNGPVNGLPERAARWLAQARAAVQADPSAIGDLFPAARRQCGDAPLPGAGATADEAARAELVAALPFAGPALSAALGQLYACGDAAERRGVLHALTRLEPRLGPAARPLVEDALRTNDPRLVTAALGGYAARHLAPAAYRQAVLKCVFMGIPVAGVPGLNERCDAELVRMLTDFAAERTAAGRPVPPDILSILDREHG